MISRALARAVVVLVGQGTAFAQANVNYQAVNAFLFDRPSTAREMGLANATIGMGDDASAGLSNPATLRLLVRGEIAADSEFPNAFAPMISGGQVVRPGLGGLPVAPASLQFSDRRIVSPQTGFAVSYIGFAYPTSRFAVSAFIRNSERAARLDGLNELQSTSATRFDLSPTFSGGGEAPTNQVGLTVAEYGGGASVSIMPRLSVGASLVAGVVDGSAAISGFAFDAIGRGAGETFVSASNQDTSIGYNVGVSWSPTSRVHIGVAHHRGYTSTWTTTRQAFGLTGQLPQQVRTAPLQVPDWTGGGVGFRVTETWRLLADVRVVRYSQTRDGLVSLFFGAPDQFRVDDAPEIRIGSEYVVPFATSSLAIRAGVWRDPAHPLEYVGNNALTGALLREVFTDRIGSRTHVTGGAGLSVGHFELSAAIDVADRYRSAAASAAFRFK